MSIRTASRKLATVAATTVLAGTVAGLTFVAPAFASGPSNGSQVPSSAVPGESFTAGAPFASGQSIDVTIPANSDLQPGNKVNILECGDPGGSLGNLPTDITGCDGKTVQGDTVLVQSNGSVSYDGYSVFALPNVASLGESPTDAPACDLSNECVLYVGENQNDFTAPHVFSQPFYVAPESGDVGTPAGDGASQNLAFSSAPAHPYVGFSYTPVVAAGPSHNPVTVGIDASSSGCSLTGAVVSFTSTGTCVIDASEPGNATYAAAVANQSVNLTVDTSHFAIETTSLSPATRGDAYGPVTFAATGGPGPYKWKKSAGTLPKGLHFKSNGILSGTPKTKHVSAGTYHFTVSATTKKSKAHPTKQTVSQAETLVLN
jgi:hypothetical protein